MKSVPIWSFSGSCFPAFGLNTAECREIWSISPYSVRMRENTDKKNCEHRHFLCSIPLVLNDSKLSEMKWIIFYFCCRLLSAIILIQTICHIIRLPSCFYYGNFSVKYEDQMYSADVIKQLNQITLAQCSANCVTNDLCKFFNYNNSNQTCYLLRAEYYYVYPNNLVEKTGWTFWTTEYKPFKVRQYIDFVMQSLYRVRCINSSSNVDLILVAYFKKLISKSRLANEG